MRRGANSLASQSREVVRLLEQWELLPLELWRFTLRAV